jgi:RNA polymerase subunit RPABC4/transcription elongation factor Spt4
MKRYCRRCRTRLRPSNVKCPYCREPSVSWLHRAVMLAFAVPAVVYLLRVL